MADPIILEGINTALKADGTVTGYVGGKIYYMIAVPEPTLPYVIISHAGGGDVYDTPKSEIDEDWDVKVIADDALEAQTIQAALKACLNGADLTLTGGWAVIACQHTTPFLYYQKTDQRQYWYGGGCYRIRAVKET